MRLDSGCKSGSDFTDADESVLGFLDFDRVSMMGDGEIDEIKYFYSVTICKERTKRISATTSDDDDGSSVKRGGGQE